MKFRNYYFSILILFFWQCTPSELHVASYEIGRSLTMDGNISDKETLFVFPLYKKGGTIKDLFNFYYFNGDTLCVSFRLNKIVNPDNTTIEFINPENDETFTAERIDFNTYTVSGFSLIGTLMEQFNSEELDGAVPADKFNGRKVPFSVKLIVKDKKRYFEKVIKGQFSLSYKEQ